MRDYLDCSGVVEKVDVRGFIIHKLSPVEVKDNKRRVLYV